MPLARGFGASEVAARLGLPSKCLLFRGDFVDDALDHALEQRFLVGKIVQKTTLAEACPLGDGFKRQAS